MRSIWRRGDYVDSVLIGKAEDAFYAERYDEAGSFALMAKDAIENGESEVSFWVRVGGFFRAYWIYVLVFMVFVVGFLSKKIIGVFRNG